MAYANFTKSELIKKFGVKIKDATLFNDKIITLAYRDAYTLTKNRFFNRKRTV
jgi:hypothetical protein